VTIANAATGTRTLISLADATTQIVRKGGGGVRFHEACDAVALIDREAPRCGAGSRSALA